MKTLKQQVLFLLVAFLSVFAFFLYQEDITRFFQLRDIYLKPRLYKYGFSILLNYAFISLFYLILRKTFATILLSQFIIFLLSFINIKKEQYLSASFVPSDFLLFKETFVASPIMLKIAVFAAIVVFIGLFVFLYKKEKLGTKPLLLTNSILSFAILGFFITANFKNNFSEACANAAKNSICQYAKYLPNTRGDWIGDHLTIKYLGFSTFFFSKTVDGLNNKIFQTQVIPEEKVAAFYQPMAVEHDEESTSNLASDDPSQQKQLPNIVFVMSESHWDARKLDKSIPPNITPTISKNQVSSLLSPSFGGGTANVEFEVLTSLNTYLNHNELAYVSKLKRPTYSLPMYLNTLGYETTAMHNNGKYFYNRSAVYQNLGFNRFTSIENMINMADRAKYINAAGWATDDLIYNSIENQLKNTDKPQFIYAISVENHPMYSDDRFGKDHFKITKDGVSENSKRALNTYLTGMQRADDKFKTLIEHVKQLDRPTIVIFFGDHLPNLQSVYDEYGFFKSAQEKAEKKDVRFFETPLAVWANFPIDQKQFKGPFVAAHFLAPKVLEAAHIPLSPYYAFVNKVGSCYSTVHQTGTQKQKSCEFDQTEILQQYKDMNMDVLNGKNFTYQMLKSKAES
ncbi:LTA synthase family protein [Acinetobacter guillouiae]|uniref:LTA synthase family protein n=1 Tax=Acinetobacter TaxID=469 RepID=UPI001FBBDE1C|nr:alkaline phosphatase family protein [Acinetobacter sp. NyZ410]UOH18538.1 sulfatase-like hydrolase/transferase [Acinetobacter sp. NyZ410]